MTDEKQPTYKQRIAAAKTAYLSIPTYLKDNQEAVLRDCRVAFPGVRIGNFESEFEASEFKDWKSWRDAFKAFIADCDLLIVACDSSRLATRGVCAEIDTARRAGKPVTLFKADDREQRGYWGYQRLSDGRQGGRLLKGEEGRALWARLMAEREKAATTAGEGGVV